jgi:hypothetical protein
LSGRAYESSIVTNDLFSRRLFYRKVLAAFCLATNTLLLLCRITNVACIIVYYRIVIYVSLLSYGGSPD